MVSRIREVGSNQMVTLEEFERSLGLSPLTHQAMRRDFEEVYMLGLVTNRVKKGWLRKLCAAVCTVNSQAGSLEHENSYPIVTARTRAVKSSYSQKAIQGNLCPLCGTRYHRS